MSLLGYFSHSSEKALATELVTQLTKDLPSTLIDTRRKHLSVNKVTRLLERTYQSAAAYQLEQGIGFIKRAVLANAFKWELKSKGYPDDFVEMATEGLVVTLSKRKPAAKTADER